MSNNEISYNRQLDSTKNTALIKKALILREAQFVGNNNKSYKHIFSFGETQIAILPKNKSGESPW